MDLANIGEAQNTSDILVAIGKMQVELKGIDKKVDELNRLSNLLQVTEQSAKSAHNRIDDLKGDIGTLKKDLLEKLTQQKTELEKDLLDLQKVYDKELAAIRRDYDKEMIKQDEKWGERLKDSIKDWQNELKPFVKKQEKEEKRADKIQTIMWSWLITTGLGALWFLIKYFN